MTALLDFQEFEDIVGGGIEVEHSGQDKIVVYTVQDFYNADEVACEEWFSNSYDCTLSVEDILSGNYDLQFYEFDEIVTSFNNGQKKQASTQFDNLDDQQGFIEWVESSSNNLQEIINILAFLLSENV